jgi:bifunctional non-homologous end joining protein LigD
MSAFPVQLAHETTEAHLADAEFLFPPDQWVMERKWDGWRFVFERAPDGVRSYAGRNGSDYTGKLPEIEGALWHLPVGTVIDTEVIAVGENLHSSDVTSVIAYPHSGKLVAIAFDLIQVAGLDATGNPWTERRAALTRLLERVATSPVYLNPVYEPDATVYRQMVDQGAEGVILKRKAATYQKGKRSHDWLKLKKFATADAIVTGFKAGQNGWSGTVGAFEVQMVDSAAETRVAVEDDAMRHAVTANPEAYRGKRLELKHYGLGKTGVPRHPTFLRWREDLEAA